MWGWGRNNKDDEGSSASAGNRNSVLSSPKSPMSLGGANKIGNFNSSKSNNKTFSERSKQRRRSWGGKDKRSSAGELLSAVTIMEKGNSFHLTEAYSGIEVSLSQDKTAQSPANKNGLANPFLSASSAGQCTSSVGGAISLPQQLAERQKVYRAQFQSVHAMSSASDAQARSPMSSASMPIDIRNFRKSKDHRLPLFDSKISIASYDDAMDLLKGYVVKDELQCVQDEIENTESEILSIEKDRGEIERLWVMNSTSATATTIETRGEQRGGESSSGVDRRMELDVNRFLATSQNIPIDKITQLQKERGLCLTVCIENAKTLESLLAKCGGKATTMSTRLGMNSRTKQGQDTSMITTVRPSVEGRSADGGGGASNIQNVTLMKCTGAESSFFVSRDVGNAFYHGRLPDRMFRRLRSRASSINGVVRPAVNQAVADPPHGSRDLLYLSTGPFGSYYCEFRSGECWWGLTTDDDELDAIFNEWDVYKVAFGPCSTLELADGTAYASTSWIVIARDGRAAWKNLPARLHNKLSSRLANETAPSEISLGCGGSYFVRFLGGKYIKMISISEESKDYYSDSFFLCMKQDRQTGSYQLG